MSNGQSDKPYEWAEIPLTGKCRPAEDGTRLGEGDFQILRNMRYGVVCPKSIGGMTKINTSVINATYLKPRSGFHFKKDQPSESHQLVQSFNTGLTASKVYENTTAIPNQGNFTATEIWSDSAGADIGYFSKAPDGCVAYANGKEACVWGGNEYRCSGFVVGDLEETIKYDYTEKINNTLTDAKNIATMHTVAETVDANTLLLLHMNGVDGSTTFTDSSPTTPHVVTANGDAQIDTTYYRFATASGLFDGTGDYLSIPDDADFNISAGTWSIDFWIRGNWSGTGTDTIYWQRTDDTNYFALTIERTAGGNNIKLSVYAAAAEVIALTTSGGVLNNTTWHHVEVTENGDNFYIFVDGVLKAQLTGEADRPANYSQSVFIGARSLAAGQSNYFKGHLDELRLSGTPRHTADFTPRTMAYGTANVCYAYVASTRPIEGFKPYVATANASAATVEGFYWASGKWNSLLSVVDGTSAGGKTLAQTGSISFTSTVSTAKPKVINGVYAYWYLITFIGIDATTTISYVTLDAAFQAIVDIWDGIPHSIAAFYRYTTQYIDESTNVLAEDYVSGDTLSYSNVGTLTSAQYIIVGFAQRVTGINFELVSGQVNAVSTIMSIYYWNGSAWTSVGNISDGTKQGTASFAKSGYVTWDAPSEAVEFKNSISNSELWYYYKVQFNATLTASVYIDKITAIPAQKTLKGYAYPVMWQNRIWYLNEKSHHKNAGLCSAQYTVCVFNGLDSTTLYFGGDEEVLCGATLFTRFGSSVYDNLVVLKRNEVWLVDGQSPSNYIKYQISDNYGCVAPSTLKSCDMGYEIVPGITKHVLIWQSSKAIVLYDGNTIVPISADIENYFDPLKSECINSSYVHLSQSFYDDTKYEYHWLFYSGSTPTLKEWVYDLRQKKWYEINRGTGKAIIMGYQARDTSGNAYMFGGIDTGYIERLEYGQTFDGNSIVSEYKTGDIPFSGWNAETQVRRIKHLSVAKTTTTNSLSLTHYGDCLSSSTDTASLRVTSSGKRVAKDKISISWGNHVFHSFHCSMTTSNENIGYEPIGLAIGYKTIREDL